MPGASLASVSPLPGGNHGETSVVVATGAGGELRFVGRRLPPGPVGRVRRIVSVLDALVGTPVPVPAVAWHRDAEGDASMLTRWVDGHPFAELPSAEIEVERLAAMLVELHELEPPGELPVFPSHPSLGYRERIRSSALGARAVELLDGWRPTPSETVLVHGDFGGGNVLWCGGGIAAVIDWDRVSVGSRAADVASARLDLRLRHGEDAARRFLERYEARAGAVHELRYWDLRALASCSVGDGATQQRSYAALGLRQLTPELVSSRVTRALAQLVDEIT
jgi:aminoglycoside phosphotransferase (APT) family kinase protein